MIVTNICSLYLLITITTSKDITPSDGNNSSNLSTYSSSIHNSNFNFNTLDNDGNSISIKQNTSGNDKTTVIEFKRNSNGENDKEMHPDSNIINTVLSKEGSNLYTRKKTFKENGKDNEKTDELNESETKAVDAIIDELQKSDNEQSGSDWNFDRFSFGDIEKTLEKQENEQNKKIQNRNNILKNLYKHM